MNLVIAVLSSIVRSMQYRDFVFIAVLNAKINNSRLGHCLSKETLLALADALSIRAVEAGFE
jgi:hypothetical protein